MSYENQQTFILLFFLASILCVVFCLYFNFKIRLQ